MKRFLGKIRDQRYIGKLYLEDTTYNLVKEMNFIESNKVPQRYEVINFLLETLPSKDKTYLEIGVRFPEDNFLKINAKIKFGVDPGIENKENPVEFKMTSDEFFYALNNGDILSKKIKFDIIFIDGLHLADQVEKDIKNALDFIKEEGFIVVHDCNPPSEYHTREDYTFTKTPASIFWNGTTWKAFYKSRLNNNLSCACIDSDWGIGIISKVKYFDYLKENNNPFFEYSNFQKTRKQSLNLMSFEEFKQKITKLNT